METPGQTRKGIACEMMQDASLPSADPSVTALISDIGNDVRDLLLQELTLAKRALKDELRKTRTDAISVGWG